MNTREYRKKLSRARDVAVQLLLDYSMKKRTVGGRRGIPAIMFDIDDTLVNYIGEPLGDIIKVYKVAKALGFKIIVITARSETYTNQTRRELDSIGIEPDFLYLRAKDDRYSDFKLAKKTYLKDFYDIDIVLSMGDQWIDVNGKNSGTGIKLPSVQDNNLYVIKRQTAVRV